MANIKQPRASIACSRNRDPDYLLLASEGIEGLAAVALFDALLCAAKDQDNEGRFNLPEKVIAAMVGVEIKTYSNLIQRLIKIGWLIIDGQGVAIRSFIKWNPRDERGGRRLRAGRPSKIGNQNNQSEIKTISNDIQNSLSPSPSPLPSPLKATTLPDKSGETVKSKRIEYSDSFEQFWQHVPSDKKSGKGAAYKVWQRLSDEDRLKAVDRMEWTAGCFEALDPGRQRIQYLTDPQGWLNQRKFEDADEAVKLVARGK